MNTRIPQSGKAAKLAKEFLLSQGADISHQQCLELVARLHGYQNWQAMSADTRFASKQSLTAQSSAEYVLDPKAEGARIDVSNVRVCLKQNKDGVTVELFGVGPLTSRVLSSARLSFAEATASGKDSSTAWIQYDKKSDTWYWCAKEAVSPLAQGLMPPEFAGKRGVDWDGPFLGHEDLMVALVESRDDDDDPNEVNWVRPDAPLEAQCNVFQEGDDAASDLPIRKALEMAESMRNSGAGGVWTVETEDGELIAIFH